MSNTSIWIVHHVLGFFVDNLFNQIWSLLALKLYMTSLFIATNAILGKKQYIFGTMRFLRYCQQPWYVPLPRMVPSTNLFLWNLTPIITSQVPLPIVGREPDYIITSLSHQQRDPFMCNTSYILYLKSWFSIAQCAVCLLRFPCIQNVPGYYMYILCIWYRGIKGKSRI